MAFELKIYNPKVDNLIKVEQEEFKINLNYN